MPNNPTLFVPRGLSDGKPALQEIPILTIVTSDIGLKKKCYWIVRVDCKFPSEEGLRVIKESRNASHCAQLIYLIFSNCSIYTFFRLFISRIINPFDPLKFFRSTYHISKSSVRSLSLSLSLGFKYCPA